MPPGGRMPSRSVASYVFGRGRTFRRPAAPLELFRRCWCCALPIALVLQAYRDQVDRVDAAIAGHLRDRLGAAQSGEDMYRLFSRFNVLLVRPKIQSAIHQFQSKVCAR